MLTLLTRPVLSTLYQWIVEHFRNYRRKRPWTFFWQIFLELLFIALTLGTVLQLTVELVFEQNIPESSRFDGWSATSLVILLILIVPPLETLFLQALPISIARYYGLKLELQIFCSLLPFSLLHISDGSLWGLIPGVVGGGYFAFTYVL
jgi:ABC-type sulfate transport system permease subunit